MEKESKFYIYEGPVYMFNNIIDNDWYGQTWAVSKKKALSNLAYQFKLTFGYTKDASIRLDKKYLSEEGGRNGELSV